MIQVLFTPGTKIIAIDPDRVVFERQGRRMALRGTNDLASVFRTLAPGQADLRDIRASAGAAEVTGAAGAADATDQVSRALNMLAARQLVRFRCFAEGRELLGAEALGPLGTFDLTHTTNDDTGQRPLQLSRFAYAHRDEQGLVIDCPHRSTRLTAGEAGIGGYLVTLAAPITRAELVRHLPALPPELAGECIALLLAAGAAAEADDDGLLPEDRHPALAQREFHDVLMHSRSRYGMGGGPTGATFSFAGIIPPLPALKPPSLKPTADDHLLPLPRPDLTRLASCDPPLVTTMETRQSRRRHGDRPLSLDELGEFLYRVGRVRDIKPANPADPHSYETTRRTYPSGGAVYDLEIYLVAHQCAGVAPGMYHYEPADHALSLIQQDERILQGLLRYARMSSGFAGVPQALFVISSRFTRLSWKYHGIAYATTLRNVGVLYEAMYLAATAMGLAPCALGGGNSQLFAEATALDPLTESSVGEFMLGTVAG